MAYLLIDKMGWYNKKGLNIFFLYFVFLVQICK